MADFQTDQKGTSVCFGRGRERQENSPNPTRTMCEVNFPIWNLFISALNL